MGNEDTMLIDASYIRGPKYPLSLHTRPVQSSPIQSNTAPTAPTAPQLRKSTGTTP
jgi:hypothetical protein